MFLKAVLEGDILDADLMSGAIFILDDLVIHFLFTLPVNVLLSSKPAFIFWLALLSQFTT